MDKEVKYLNEENVKETIKHCLFRKEEVIEASDKIGGFWPKDKNNIVMGKGILGAAVLNKTRLEEKRELINNMLDDLGDRFAIAEKVFLASLDKNDNIWARKTVLMEILLILGDAIGRVKLLKNDEDATKTKMYILPREDCE